MKQFEGKTAVITGGASGIGLALAQRFADAQMNVVLADIEETALAIEYPSGRSTMAAGTGWSNLWCEQARGAGVE